MYQKNAGTGTQWSQNYEAAADDSGSMRSGLVILQCSCSFPFSVQRLRLGPPLRSCDLTQTIHMSYLISRHRAFLILVRVNIINALRVAALRNACLMPREVTRALQLATIESYPSSPQ
jgi:hypothetical protein